MMGNSDPGDWISEKGKFQAEKINSIKASLLNFINGRLYEGRPGNAKVVFTIRDRHVQEKDILSWRYWIGLDKADLNDRSFKEEINCFLGHDEIKSNQAPCVFYEERDVSGTARPGQNWMLLHIPKNLNAVANTDYRSPFYFHRNYDESTFDSHIGKFIEIVINKEGCKYSINDSYKHSRNKEGRLAKQEKLTEAAQKAAVNCLPQEWKNKYNNNSANASLAFLMRAIDYYFLFKDYDYILSYGLIFGGYHIITFYILLKDQGCDSTANEGLFSDWTSIDWIIKEWEYFGRPFFNVGTGSDRSLELLRFLGEIESVINTCWTETLNSVLAHRAYTHAYEGSKLGKVLTKTCEEMLLMMQEVDLGNGKTKKQIDMAGTNKKECSFVDACYEETNFHVHTSEVNTTINKKECKNSKNDQCICFKLDAIEGMNIEMAFKNIKVGNIHSANTNIPRIINAFCEQYSNVILTSRKNLIRAAIVNILIDSFSHNIGAHSLSAVVWTLALRNELLEQRFKKIENGQYSNIEYIKPYMISGYNRDEEENIDKVTIQASQQYALINKKDSTYNEDWFSLNDIINYYPEGNRGDDDPSVENILSFRAITSTGNISINPKWPIPMDGDAMKMFRYVKNKAAFWNGVTSDIAFGGEQVDVYDLLFEFIDNPLFISTIAHSEKINKVKIYYSINADEQGNCVAEIEYLAEKNRSRIIFQNEISKYEEEWKKPIYRIYLPGGTVGKHALFTILENTMRNIKHAYNPNSELRFHIAITPNDQCAKNKVTVWLGNPSLIEDYNKIERKSNSSILCDNGDLVLGGSSQDQICAAMLMTSKFAAVENVELNYGEPWIGLKKIDLPDGLSLLKKSFDLWRGEFIHDLRPDEPKSDNQSRYNILRVNGSDMSEYMKQLSESGIVRLMYDGDGSSSSKMESDEYNEWNRKWLGPANVQVYKASSNEKVPIFRIINGQIADDCTKTEQNQVTTEIIFAHGSGAGSGTASQIRYRNHGVLREHYYLNDHLQFTEKTTGILKSELIETILTRIAVFDNRLNERVVKKSRREALSTSLSISFYEESKSEFEKILNKINTRAIIKPNVIIMHLTMIEKMKNPTTNTEYGELGIASFIDEYLKDHLDDCCKLIVVTGRGRDEWWKALKKAIPSDRLMHVMSKPIESMLTAVEDGLILGDDVNIKHNICKIIFGS